MSVFDLLKGVIGSNRTEQEVVGTIVEGPTKVEGDGSSDHILIYRLDAQPDVEFRQEDRPLAPSRKRGDRVRIRYQMGEDGVADVEWMESAA